MCCFSQEGLLLKTLAVSQKTPSDPIASNTSDKLLRRHIRKTRLVYATILIAIFWLPLLPTARCVRGAQHKMEKNCKQMQEEYRDPLLRVGAMHYRTTMRGPLGERDRRRCHLSWLLRIPAPRLMLAVCWVHHLSSRRP